MFGVDPILILLAVIALAVIFLAMDFLFAGGGMTSAVMGGAAQCGAAMMASPYGWMVLVAVIVVVLGLFGFLFR